MKTIGIVGGLSPESTVLYYTTIVEEYRRRCGNEEYPEIVIYSVNFGKFTRLMEEGRFEEAANIIIKAVKSLHKAGADFAIISANTPHMFLSRLLRESPIPIISIIDALAEKLIQDNIGKVGLLGTKFTLTQQFYVKELRKYGIEALVPDSKGIEIVNRIIYEELVKGIIKDSSREKLLAVAKELIRRGAEAIALACTELPLILKDGMGGIRFYDTAKIHAIKALEYALK